MSNNFKNGTTVSSENIMEKEVTMEMTNSTVNNTENSTQTSNTDSTVLYLSEFFSKSSEGTDIETVINGAISEVVTNGGKLIFDEVKTYAIKEPIKICPPSKSSNPNVYNFEIDFNHCTFTVLCDENNPFSPIEYTDPEDKEKKILIETMLYVNAGFPYEERIGIIRNVNLECGYNNLGSGLANGMYLHASSHIKYEGITIKDAQTGVYIAKGYEYSPTRINNTIEVFMYDIEISKSVDNNGKIHTEKIPTLDDGNFDPYNYFTSSEDIGLECNATDCHFSNIRVYDYVVGFKMTGGDNRIRNSIVTNDNSQNQYRYSVGYINGSPNFYIDCTVYNFYIGWMPVYTVPLFLTKCLFNAARIGTVAYQFYIPFTDYSGGGIYATDCIKWPSMINNLLLCNLDEKGIENNININTSGA